MRFAVDSHDNGLALLKLRQSTVYIDRDHRVSKPAYIRFHRYDADPFRLNLDPGIQR